MTLSNKDAIDKVSKEPCRCVRCKDCSGTGKVRFDGVYCLEDYDLELCDTCVGSGISEICFRCILLEMDHEAM